MSDFPTVLVGIAWWRCPMELGLDSWPVVAYHRFLRGLRYVRIEERLLWLSKEIHGGKNAKGSYDIQTHNALVGFQFGGNYKWVTKNWSAGAAGKVGAYVNFADSKRVVHGEGDALIPGTRCVPDRCKTINMQPTYRAFNLHLLLVHRSRKRAGISQVDKGRV